MKTYEEIISSSNFKNKLEVLNDNLNKSLRQHNFEPQLIGNLFYDHGAKISKYSIVNYECEEKRRRFVLACQDRKTMLEVGLNGGHSAFLALMSNPEIKVISNDLAEQFIFHPEIYTVEAARTLKEMFGDRFEFIKGDCLKAIPQFIKENQNIAIDLMHIDGAKNTYMQDFINIYPVASSDCLVIFDDFQQGGTKKVVAELLKKKLVIRNKNFPTMSGYRLTNEILNVQK